MLIHRFEADIPRARFMDMDDWEMTNVIGRPDFHQGKPERGYWPVSRSAFIGEETRDIGPKELWYASTGKAMKVLGASDTELEEEWKKWKAKLTFHYE